MATATVISDVKLAQSRLRKQAAALRQEIRAELLRTDDEHYIDLAGRVHDTAEESVADLLADLKFASIDRQITELRAVEAALQRISMGSYNVCEVCGEAIGTSRLQALPAAARCIKCQDLVEKRSGITAHQSL